MVHNNLKVVIRSISLTYMILNLPFSSLRVFEAVVRCEGFSAAADELGVSQSAVSQHVRGLEEWLGRALLIRGARKSRPTDDGRRLALAISEGLGRISDVCSELRDRRRNENTIVISSPPGFAFLWLFPRLIRFDLAHPDLTISIMTEAGEGGLPGSTVDVAIRYGFGDEPGFDVEPLMEERLYPVCAPSLLNGPRPLREVADFAHQTLLQDDVERYGAASPNWAFWARETGMHLPTPERTRRFGQSNLVVQAAKDGMGVGLGREPMVIDAVVDGQLVCPFPRVALSPLSYWLVYRRGGASDRKTSRFLEWIKQEVADLPVLPF
jgi:LysR family glycine cleavage system transcriptional activator